MMRVHINTVAKAMIIRNTTTGLQLSEFCGGKGVALVGYLSGRPIFVLPAGEEVSTGDYVVELLPGRYIKMTREELEYFDKG